MLVRIQQYQWLVRARRISLNSNGRTKQRLAAQAARTQQQAETSRQVVRRAKDLTHVCVRYASSSHNCSRRAQVASIQQALGFSAHSALGHHDFVTQSLEQSVACFAHQSWLVVQEVLDAVCLQYWALKLVDGV